MPNLHINSDDMWECQNCGADLGSPFGPALQHSCVSAQLQGAQMTLTDQHLRERAERLAGGHLDCEDPWYSCPLSEGGNPQVLNETDKECWCGRDGRAEAIFRELREVADQQKKADIKTVEDYAFALHESEAYDLAMAVAKAAKKVMDSQ